MNDPILHVYGQYGNHSELVIAGNRKALIELSRLLKYAIQANPVNAHVKLHQEIRVWALKSAPP